MELIVKEKTFELPAEISNLEELRQSLTPELDFYKSVIVTEDSIKSAKSDKSDLNKLKKAIDKRRKDIKEAYLEPYQAIESECQQLIALIDEPIMAIDNQLKAFDEKALQDKRNDLDDYFRNENPPDYVTLDDVLPEKWRNKSESSDSLKEQIKEKIFQIKTDFSYLKNMYSDSGLWTAIFKNFTETKSREQTLAYAVELERFERRLNASAINSADFDIISPVEHQTAATDDSERPERLSGVFRATCTAVQLKNLRDFMKSNSISFEVVK